MNNNKNKMKRQSNQRKRTFFQKLKNQLNKILKVINLKANI